MTSRWDGTVTQAVSARRTSDHAVRPAASSGFRDGRASSEMYGEPSAAAAAPASRTASPSRTPTVRSAEPGSENTPYGRLCGPKGSPSGTSKGGMECCLTFVRSVVTGSLRWSHHTLRRCHPAGGGVGRGGGGGREGG